VLHLLRSPPGTKSEVVAHVGYWGKTGQHLLVLSFTGFEPICDIIAQFLL
jgi:hypothetical protein